MAIETNTIPCRDAPSKKRKFGWLGFGLREQHLDSWHLIKSLPFIEVLADNLIGLEGGQTYHQIQAIADKAIVFAHSVSMNIGGHSPLDLEYLEQLEKVFDWLKPKLISDHLAQTSIPDLHSHSLLPIIKNRANLARICQRVSYVSEYFNKPMMLENIAASICHKDDEMTDLGFLEELCQHTGCGVLLDISNLWITCHNLELDIESELSKISAKNVWQYHIAGFSFQDDILIDSHDHAIDPKVAQLCHIVHSYIGKRPTIIERDDSHSFHELMKNAEALQYDR